MEAQSHGLHHHEEEDLQYSGEGEHNQHGEKKSVLKKVKDKAKKIKDTITKQVHEHEYPHHQISEEEDDDEDEDMVNTPDQVHDLPMYESPVIPGTSLPIQTDVNLENPTDTREDRYSPNVGDGGVFRPSGPVKMETELERSSVEEARRPELENLPQSSPDATFVEEANVAEPTVQISPLMGFEEDPHSPKIHPVKNHPSNYQSKVTDPTGKGGQEAEVSPLLQRLDNFHIHDESQSDPASEEQPYTGSHDQFAPQSTPTVDQFVPESNPANLSKYPEPPGSLDRAKPESMPRDTIVEKISSAKSAIAGKAVSAKDIVASKLGYGGQPQYGDVSSNKKPVTDLATDYGHKVAEKLVPVYDKIAGAGSAVISKVQGGGEAEGGEKVAEGTERGGVSVKEYLAEKLRPGEEDKALSEAIRGRFYKKKEGMQGTEEKEVQPVGRVMEPQEVATCTGAAGEAIGNERSGGGAVNRLKGAVGSWLGKGSGMRSANHSLGQTEVDVAGSVPGVGIGESKEEVGSQQPRLQESGN